MNPIKITALNHGDGWSETWEVNEAGRLFVEDGRRRGCSPYGVCAAAPLLRGIAELESSAGGGRR